MSTSISAHASPRPRRSLRSGSVQRGLDRHSCRVACCGRWRRSSSRGRSRRHACGVRRSCRAPHTNGRRGGRAPAAAGRRRCARRPLYGTVSGGVPASLVGKWKLCAADGFRVRAGPDYPRKGQKAESAAAVHTCSWALIACRCPQSLSHAARPRRAAAAARQRGRRASAAAGRGGPDSVGRALAPAGHERWRRHPARPLLRRHRMRSRIQLGGGYEHAGSELAHAIQCTGAPRSPRRR